MDNIKQCVACRQHLPLDDFNRYSRSKDGRQPTCRQCARNYGQANKAHRAEVARKWANTPRGKELRAIYDYNDRVQNPEKYKARYTLTNALRSGKIMRKPCEFCGNEKTEAHHEDYSKPLDIIWACFRCHREILHGEKVVVKDGEK